MVVVYSIDNNKYGFMCFTDGASIAKIYEYINECLWTSSIKIIFAGGIKDATKVMFYHDGKYYIEDYLFNLDIEEVEEVNNVYTHLYNKYGNNNILGFL